MRRELIDPDRSLFEGDSAYRFQHVLIRDAAYSSLPKRARAELHERFAEWLEQRVAHRIEEYREILAHHFEQAYRLLADVAPDDPHLAELADRARAYLAAAARHASELGDTATAFAVACRAIDLPLPPSADAVDLLIEACRIGWRAGASDRLLEISGRAQALARSLGDDDRELLAQVHALDARLMADTTFSTADARAVAETAVARLSATGDARGLYDALVAVSSSYHHEGRWGRMIEVLSRAQQVAAELGDERLERDAATQRLGCLYWGDAPVTEGLAFCDELDRRWPSAPLVQMRVLAARARFLGLLGRLDEADRTAARWVAHAEAIGNTVELESRAFTTAFLADLAGDLERAESELSWSIERLDRRGMRGLVATLAGLQSVVLGRLGRWDEAASAVALARQRSHPDDLDSESIWRVAEAAVLAQRGEPDAAIAMCRAAIEVIDRSDEIVFQANARMLLSDLLGRRGDPVGARTAAEEALDRYRRKECDPGAARAQERLQGLAPA
jgi:tetratricopeptide (TPR) repeat protein